MAFYRDQRKLSAQHLAGQCAELGMPSLSRVVITKLENGRREAVSTAELQVLAAALGVPPMLLLFPLGYAPAVEVLPGLHADPWAAIAWFSGSSEDPADLAAPPQLGTHSPIVLWNEHVRCEDEIARMDAYRASSRDPEDRTNPLVTPEIFASNIEVLTAALRRVRQIMREQGMTPPHLRPETARVLGEEDPDGAR